MQALDLELRRARRAADPEKYRAQARACYAKAKMTRRGHPKKSEPRKYARQPEPIDYFIIAKLRVREDQMREWVRGPELWSSRTWR